MKYFKSKNGNHIIVGYELYELSKKVFNKIIHYEIDSLLETVEEGDCFYDIYKKCLINHNPSNIDADKFHRLMIRNYYNMIKNLIEEDSFNMEYFSKEGFKNTLNNFDGTWECYIKNKWVEGFIEISKEEYIKEQRKIKIKQILK
jgi:hypothetical protein